MNKLAPYLLLPAVMLAVIPFMSGSSWLALTVAGTSGGIPYFSSASAWASSGILNTGFLVKGGGAGAAAAAAAGC